MSPALMRSAYLLTGDRGQAEDLLQAALWRVARSWAAIEGPPGAYAHRVLINLSRDHRRWLGRRVREVSERIPPRARSMTLRQPWRSATGSCRGSVGCRAVSARLWCCGSCWIYSVEQEAAAVLGATEGTVKSHSSRALSQLRELLTEQSEGSDHLDCEVRHAD